MTFTNYCIILLGETEGALFEIAGIAENKPRVIRSNGIMICTFTSIASANELEDYIIGLGRNFFLFEIDANNTGFHLNNEKVFKGLFAGLSTKSELTDKVSKLMDDIKNAESEKVSGDTEDIPTINLKLETKKVETKVRPRQDFYENMTKKEREEVMDDILDKGYDNLSEYDRQVLKILTKIR